MPASAASEQPSAHEKLESQLGARAGERGEVAVVDDGAHRDAEPGAEQAGCAGRSRDAIATTIVMNRCQVSSTLADVEALALPKSAGSECAVVLVPDHVREADEREHQADRDHELHDERLALQVAHDRPVERRSRAAARSRAPRAAAR